MIHQRCKCGEHEWFGSYCAPLCITCEKCGSTLAGHPEGHLPPEPHKLVTKYDQNTGEPYQFCLACGQKIKSGGNEVGGTTKKSDN